VCYVFYLIDWRSQKLVQMKTLLIHTLASLSSFVYCNAIGQEVPEPEFTQKPYYLKDGKLNAFEASEGVQKAKSKSMGYGGTEISYEVPGLKSPARFNSSTFRIIIKTEGSSDPSESFIIVTAEAKKDTRRFITGTIGGTFKNKSGPENRIKISAKKIRDKVFEIAPVNEVPAGEYAIVPYIKEANMVAAAGNAPLKMYCFGID
jgi:hypothetical protein